MTETLSWRHTSIQYWDQEWMELSLHIPHASIACRATPLHLTICLTPISSPNTTKQDFESPIQSHCTNNQFSPQRPMAVYNLPFYYFITLANTVCRSFVTTLLQLKICDFSGEDLKNLKCYNFLWVQRRHNCSPAANFTNCFMTLYLVKVHLQTFLSILKTQKYQILSCDILVANER